jgi:sirohydrochlorin ferrochelatase
MKVALVDNGSLAAAAHLSLRAAAAAVGERAGVAVEAVSWKHSGRIGADLLGGVPASTLAPWVRAQVAAGEREFVFVPFFISPQGAIGSALRAELEALHGETGGFDFSFTGGLAESGALAAVVADRILTAAATLGLDTAAAIVVDHGGPSAASAAVRDGVAAEVRRALGGTVASLRAASMESPEGPGFAFNRPLLADALAEVGPGPVLIAPLFLSPGRHAGPGGDLARIARAAEARRPGLRCHFTSLVGSHPVTIETLSRALVRALRVGVHP